MKMNSKKLHNFLIKLLIVSVTISIISCATPSPFANQVPKRQFELCNCIQEIENANEYTRTLHQEQVASHDSLVNRVIQLENEFYGSIATINSILDRVLNLEIALQNNITALNQRIVDDTNAVFTTVNQELLIVSGDLNNKIQGLNVDVANLQNQINNLPPPTPPQNNGGSAIDVYYNITRRIDNLEYVKISNLTVDNNIWRRNFRVINSTFERIKSNNNCLCK